MDHTPFRRRVNYYETDQMAVVHHSNYIRFFEEARIDYLRKNGLDFAQLEESHGIMFPVLDVQCKYIQSARFNQELAIYVRLRKFTGVRIFLDYEVRFGESDVLCATGATVLGILNRDYNPVSLKHIDPDAFQRFKALAAEENEK